MTPRLPQLAATIRGFSRSLSVRLFALLSLALLGALLGLTWLALRENTQDYEETGLQWARLTTEFIQRSTHHAMLRNTKDDVHQIIRRLGSGTGVAGIRIYDKEGKIKFSANEEEIGQQVDKQAEACVWCHGEDAKLTRAQAQHRMRVLPAGDGTRVLGFMTPILNEPGCAGEECHFEPDEQSVLGVLDVKVSLAWMDSAVERSRTQLVLGNLAVTILIGLAAAAFIFWMVLRPVRALVEGTHRVAGGDLATRIDVTTSDEMGELANAFNRMTGEIERSRRELTDWSQTLEQKVEATTRELGLVQRQVAHVEKMASLGKLSATVAHELNNPLAGILTYAKLAARTLAQPTLSEEEHGEVLRYLDVIGKESRRCGDIVKSLLTFARRSSPDLSPHGLNEIVEHAVVLLRHLLEMSQVHLERTPLEGDDHLVCDGNQIEQALVAMIVNAVEAMPGGGTLRIAATRAEGGLQLALTDTGSGIPADVVPHIFEPFFSTKDKTSGVGLGLAVVYGIVQRHAGRIDVESAPGQGTTFRVWLPLVPPPTAPVERSATGS